MRTAFKASRLTGILALLAGIMALSPTASQAEGTWLRNGVAITSNTPIQAKAETELILLTKIGLSKVEILCSEFKLVNANLTPTGGGTGKIHLSSPTGCITKLNGTESAQCKPHTAGASAGLIETNAVDWLLRLHTGGVAVVEVLPTAGGSFFTLELGAECAFANKIEITGKIFLKECKNELLVDKVEHLFEEGPLSSLLLGGNAMTIDGSQFWSLVSGGTWAGHV